MTTFKNSNQYDPGNSDPFTPYGENTETDENDDTSTTDKITNSNGGTPNPPSTNK